MNHNLEYSIAVTVYNDEKKILQFLDNIYNQTYKPTEIIVVDGGSCDNTCNIIKEYDSTIKLIEGNRYTISQGLNRAIQEATNKWVGIAMTGNQYNECFFEVLIQAIEEKNLDVDGAYGVVRGKGDTWFGKLYAKEMMKEDCGIPTNHGVLINKDVFEETGGFCDDWVYAGEDAEYYRRLYETGRKFYCEKKAVVVWDAPQNYREYFRQTYWYTIGEMQMLSNGQILAFYGKKNIIFFFLNLLALLAVFMNSPMIIKGILLLLVAVGDIWLIFHSWSRLIAWYITTFTRMICLMSNVKYLERKNKIDGRYIIRKVHR